MEVPSTKETSSQTVPVVGKADELVGCMVHWYNERHHDQRAELQEWTHAYHQAEKRNARLYQDAVHLEELVNHYRRREAQIIAENDTMFQLVIDMARVIPEEQQRAFMTRLTGTIAGENGIDLTTDEEMTETDEE